ncbi:MAG: hypothetical protein J6S50_00625 [Oscillospiraceae bacterium]|nr:hypothetical protein [Oscillospiraceae bacterium]MBO7727006.1 hypothetical protein [Oscillospiraceae bacterium]
MSRKVKDIPLSPLFERVIPIEVNTPHKASEVICVKCGKRWISVRQADIFLKNIVCPNCGAGYVIETGEEMKEVTE